MERILSLLLQANKYDCKHIRLHGVNTVHFVYFNKKIKVRVRFV